MNSLPNVKLMTMRDGKPCAVQTGDLFANKSVVLFGLPGAFTPTCHYQHAPSISDDVENMLKEGVDLVAITAVNDVYVMDAWANELELSDKIVLLADGNGDFARSIGMMFLARELGLGERSRRYSMWIKDGIIQMLTVEPDFTLADVTSVHAMAQLIKTLQKSRL